MRRGRKGLHVYVHRPACFADSVFSRLWQLVKTTAVAYSAVTEIMDAASPVRESMVELGVESDSLKEMQESLFWEAVIHLYPCQQAMGSH